MGARLVPCPACVPRVRLKTTLFAMALLACRSAPSEPSAAPAPVEPAPKTPSVHVLVEGDHRSRVKLAVGDYVELPHDPAFAWSIKFENGSYFDPAPPTDAGVERYKATRTGIVRSSVDGEPKACMSSDAACPTAKYAWSITLSVE